MTFDEWLGSAPTEGLRDARVAMRAAWNARDADLAALREELAEAKRERARVECLWVDATAERDTLKAALDAARGEVERGRRLLIGARCPGWMVAEGRTPAAVARLKEWDAAVKAFDEQARAFLGSATTEGPAPRLSFTPEPCEQHGEPYCDCDK